mgnify:CR=1 FL=1
MHSCICGSVHLCRGCAKIYAEVRAKIDGRIAKIALASGGVQPINAVQLKLKSEKTPLVFFILLSVSALISQTPVSGLG